ANLGLHLGYHYLNKYYVDFSAAMPHSAKLPSGNRQAISPTLSLGWRISAEDFMRHSAFNNLKLTVSGGIINTDLDIQDYYLYQGYYTNNNAAWDSGADGDLVHTYDRLSGDNRQLGYPNRREVSVRIDGALYINLITYNAAYIYDHVNGLHAQPSPLYPMYF